MDYQDFSTNPQDLYNDFDPQVVKKITSLQSFASPRGTEYLLVFRGADDERYFSEIILTPQQPKVAFRPQIIWEDELNYKYEEFADRGEEAQEALKSSRNKKTKP